MEMESARRPFDRTREMGLKKARLAQPEELINMKNSISNKFRAANDRESVDSGRGSFSQQQQQIQDLVSQYRVALAELTFNSKPIITNLTIIAGENLHAAKAIAGTVCTNILEVSSDQKLPSLYLLDSIVKNIGRDYIKYFSARLLEVFCKAYRQVDPSTHPGMRHLFGTWKGVFPPQPLQMIEKELAFPPAANGPSSGSTTSRSESQSQRPATSIHVNPKYLEARQRLQQPNKSTPLQRNAPDELVRQKNIVAEYGSYDVDSDHSSQSGLEIGVKERVIDKPWYEANSNLEEKMSIRRNGLDIKQVPSYVTPIGGKNNVPLLPRKSISGKSSIAIDESWKSSDEEEYMWDDLKSKSSDQHSIAISQRHSWTPDEPTRTGLEKEIWKPHSLHEIGSKVDSKASADAVFTERKDQAHFRNRRSPSWTEEQHLTDETIYSGSDRGRLGHSEGFTNLLSGVSMPANSLTRAPIPSHMSQSHIGTSSFGFLSNQELVPPIVGQKRRFESDSLAEQAYHQSQLPRRPDVAKSPFSGTQNMISQFSRDTFPVHPQDAVVANSPKFPPQNLQTSTSMVHSVLPRHQIPVAEPSKKYNLPTLVKNKASVNIPSTGKSLLNQSRRNSAVDSIVKNEKRAKKTGTTTPQSLSVRNPPLPSGPAPKCTPKDPIVSKRETPQVKSSASATRSQIKAEQQALPPGLPPSSQVSDSASDSVSSLLSTLVAKGLITASKSESPTSSTQKISTSPPSLKPCIANTSLVPVSSVPVTSDKKVSAGTVTSNKKVSAGTVTSNKKVSSGTGTSNKKVSAGSVTSNKKVSSGTATSNKKVSADTATSNKIVSADIATSNKIVSADTNEPPKSAEKCSIIEAKPLIGLDFKPDLIRQSHPSVIGELLHDLPHQCDLCGLRLKLQERLERHLEWHASRKPEDSCQNSRRWYSNQENWVAGKDVTCSEESTSGELEEEEVMVPADENQSVCVLCGEIFEDVYWHKTDEWMFKGAVYLSVTLGEFEIGTSTGSASKGPIVHANCISDNSVKDLGFPEA